MPILARGERTAGFLDVLPAAVAAAPFGLLLGAIAASKGLSPLEVALMSGLVFAGGSQFAAVELWVLPAPVLLLTFSTGLINARHLLMGASIARRMERFRAWQTALALFVLADEVWAVAERRARLTRLTPGYWLGLGLTLWIVWVSATTLGAAIGGVIGDPRDYGFDFAFTAIFIGLIAGFWRGPASGLVIAASAAAAVIVWWWIGPPWHVAAGAVAGIAAAMFGPAPRARDLSSETSSA